uniref:Uncharacterized protein n=1 Tax=Romanomermis culicivorax TaxID=13658 RepID=A0A915KUF9_ROMCU
MISHGGKVAKSATNILFVFVAFEPGCHILLGREEILGVDFFSKSCIPHRNFFGFLDFKLTVVQFFSSCFSVLRKRGKTAEKRLRAKLREDDWLKNKPNYTVQTNILAKSSDCLKSIYRNTSRAFHRSMEHKAESLRNRVLKLRTVNFSCNEKYQRLVSQASQDYSLQNI